MPKPNPVVIITGGHHTSGLAVALALKSQNWTVLWIGHRHTMLHDKNPSLEYQEVTAAHIPFYDLIAGKFYRQSNLTHLLRLPVGFFQAFYLILAFRLQYGAALKGVVTFGGYLGVPVSVAAWILGLPIIVHEQTVAPGWANHLISILARKIAVTWPETKAKFPSSKTVVTGLPLRSEFIGLTPSSTISFTRPVIYITGGKQGSHAINAAVFSVLPQLLSSYTIIHQTGDNSVFNDYHTAQQLRSKLPANESSHYQIFSYLTSTQAATTLTNADLVISRSGAHITYELAILGKRALLIPLPKSSHDEQNKNAQVLVNFGQAKILPQAKLTGDNLLGLLPTIIKLSPSLQNLPLDGTQKLVQLVKQQFHEKD